MFFPGEIVRAVVEVGALSLDSGLVSTSQSVRFWPLVTDQPTVWSYTHC
jgi:hypothetical protein